MTARARTHRPRLHLPHLRLDHLLFLALVAGLALFVLEQAVRHRPPPELTRAAVAELRAG